MTINNKMATSISDWLCYIDSSFLPWTPLEKSKLGNCGRAGSTFFFPQGKDNLLVLFEVTHYFLGIVGGQTDTESCFVFYLLKIQVLSIRSDKTHFFF